MFTQTSLHPYFKILFIKNQYFCAMCKEDKFSAKIKFSTFFCSYTFTKNVGFS